MWLEAEVVSALAAGLRARADEVEREQAVRGLDALDELALHPLLAAGLRGAGFGVAREARYPSDRGRRLRREARRCDLVVTPGGRPLDGPADLPGEPAEGPPCPAEAALWIEVKVVAQFRAGQPNRAYVGALQGRIWQDLAKLAREPAIVHAAQAIVLFTADRRTATHDLEVTVARGLDRGLELDAPRAEGFPIGDRAGNARCTVALVGVLRPPR